ncbi:MAG TPA: VOC family protein [Lapillicoccus sp.]|nr:VOC family protein [Lapillicoccus sp.]
MAVTWLTAFLDTAAPEAAATEAYWVAVTGWPLSSRRGENGEFASLQPSDGDGPVRVQVVGTQPPGGMHLDVHTDDVDRQVEQARGLGAEMRDTGLGYAVGRSPGGLVFCIVPHASGRRPGPVGWPGGASLVDQVCLDIPPASFDREAEFWSGLTAWPHVRGGSPQFDRILPPPGQPLRVLLQRTDDEDGPVRMHLDLASDDREAEVARHVELGGRVVRSTENWTTLLDPSGRAYCVTRRSPVSGTLP